MECQWPLGREATPTGAQFEADSVALTKVAADAVERAVAAAVTS
jgi:hypothetical protein